MKFECERSLLLNAVTIASRTVAAKSTVSALEGLLFETERDMLVITGYNLKTGIRTKVSADITESGRLVLNAKLLGDIIRKLPEGQVTVQTNKNLLVTLTCGMSYFEIIGTSAEDFPELPTVEVENSFRITEGKLQSMISQTLFAIATNDIRPVHTGSLFEIVGDRLTVVSVDGYRLALRRETLSEEALYPCSFVVPGAALTEAEKVSQPDSEEIARISLGAKHILFNIGDTEIISRRLEGEFLDYHKSLPSAHSIDVYADRRRMLNMFERVSLMINEKNKSPVRCRFETGLLKIATATGIGKATDECEFDGDGKNLEIGFNNRYMLDALRAAPGDRVNIQLSTSIGPAIICPEDPADDSYLYLILPVRIRND